MTELSPSTEVILSSDLFDDDPCLENMSALAFAVLDAYMTGYGWLDSPTKKDCRGVAAALRAAADQVVPTEMDLPPIAPDLGHFRQHERRLTRQRLLAIADELEAQ
jgi:hypothetical protein